MSPNMSSVVLVTLFSLFLNSLIVELLATSKSEEDTVCSEMSICNLTVSPKKGLYKCMCDSNCSFYGDCCPESAYYNLSAQLNGKSETQLFSCPKEYGFYVINTCPSQFADVDIRRKCENVSLGRRDFDTKMIKPVMERVSRITYSNVYCAHCNGASDFENFTLDYTCIAVKSDEKVRGKENLIKVLQKSKFNPETGVLTSTINGTDYKCFHTVITPAHLQPYTRYCEPGMISSCLETFNDTKIVEACHSQTYVVYTDSRTGVGNIYKNKYCAQCNGEDDNDLWPCQLDTEISRSSEGASSLFLSQRVAFCDDPRK